MRARIRTLRRRPRLALVVGVVIALFVGATYVGFRLHGIDLEPGVELPFAHSGELPRLDHPHVVTLEECGRLLLDGEEVVLSGLRASLAGTSRPVVVCADARARAMVLWYVLDACWMQETWVAVQDGWRTAVMRARAPEAGLPRGVSRSCASARASGCCWRIRRFRWG